MDGDIRNWPCEENYITYLARRRKGDPIPQGAGTENPFSSNPWDFPEDSWYIFEESPNGENWESDVRRTENGFWKWSSTVTIPTESVLGFKNVFQFYQGNMPIGTKTGWIMHQYHAGPNREGATHVLENISLCRLFWQNDERVNSTRPNNSPSACADFCTLGPDIINTMDERESLSRREADGNVLVNVSQDSFIEMNDLASSDGEFSELYDFSDRDVLEFNDILTSETASTSSGNLSNLSVSSDEYINIDDLLREITRDGPVSVEEEKIDCVSSFTGPVQSDQTDRDKLLKGNMSSDIETSKPHHFLNGDYLELRDFLPSNMASNKSGNLGFMGSNSGEHFNAYELLRDIARDYDAPVEEQQEKPDCRFCLKNSICSNRVSQIGSESVAGYIGNFGVADQNEQPRNQLDLVPELGPSTSSSSCAGQVKRNLSESSEGFSRRSSSSSSSNGSSSGSGDDRSSPNKSSSSKTPQSKRRKSVKRLAKIGKKLLCFS